MSPEAASYIQLFLLFFSLSIANAGSHSLQYKVFGTFNSDEGLTSYSVLGQLDDELFLHYETKNQRLEPRGAWLDRIVETDTWKKEKSNVKDIIAEFKKNLGEVMPQKTGSHTFQEIIGCKLHEDGHKTTFWNFGYDGEDFLIFQPETSTWKIIHPDAGSLKTAFEEEPETKFQNSKIGVYCQQLQAYLKVWKEQKAEFPLLKVTENKKLEGKVSLNCWAYNYFPGDIKMTWLQDGYALRQREQEIILPSGNGSYQTSVSIDVLEKSNYTCHVEHQGRNQTISKMLGADPETAPETNHGVPANLEGFLPIFCYFGVVVLIFLFPFS